MSPRIAASQEVENRAVERLRVLLMHEVRGQRDLDALDVLEQALELVRKRSPKDGGAAFPCDQQGGGVDAADVGLAKRWEARSQELSRVGAAVQTTRPARRMRRCCRGPACSLPRPDRRGLRPAA